MKSASRWGRRDNLPTGKSLDPTRQNGGATASSSGSASYNSRATASSSGSTSYEFSAVPRHSHPAKTKLNSTKRAIFLALAAFFFAYFLMGTKLLAIPFALFGYALPRLLARHRQDRERALLGKLWPELLDHMISGLRSGLSIAETISGLATRGPEISRPIFLECRELLISGSDLSQVLGAIKIAFNDPVADQVCEVLDFARGTGSRDTAVTLRTLGDFIRSDIAVRGEIQAKLGWVKNSALVAAVAPWILLLILSSQPSTVQAFATGTGILILLTGVVMSVLAYLWMSRVGRIEATPRIFLDAAPL